MGKTRKGDKRPEGAGRQKGSQNKLTLAAKEAFQRAFDDIGGVSSLAEWARDNKTDFYKLYGRLIPVVDITNVNNRFVIRAPEPARSVEEWQQRHSQVTIQ